MRKLLFTALSVVIAGCGGGGGGGSSDGGSSVPSFDGVYEGTLVRVINSCNFSFDWQDVYSVEHNAGEGTLTLQVGVKYPERYPGVVTSSDSFLVELQPQTNGSCTSQSTYTFEDITESSARVRWTVEYAVARNCLVSAQSSGPCTVAFEGVLPRS